MICSFLVGYSQEWTQLLPKKEKSELNLSDYQKAFNSYWQDKNVVNGKYVDENGNIRKAYGWKQFKRWEYYQETRVNPKTGNFPANQIHTAYLKYLTQMNHKAKSINWSSLGPDNSAGGYAGIGRVNVIEFHPSDPNIFWIGAPAGGLWVTSTGGNNWASLTDSLEVQGISAIAVPADYTTSNTLYIGTGDRDAFDNHSVGVLKSIDGGITWQNTGLVFNLAHGHAVNKLLIHPTDFNIIFAATTDGFYKSMDGGDNWTLETSTEYVDIEFHPTNPDIIYGSSRNGKVYKNNILKFSAVHNKRIELAVSNNAPDRLYILASNASYGLEGIYRSDDAGENITLIFDEKALLNWSTDGSGINDGQAWYDLALAADPLNADIIYCGGVNTWKSTNGGSSWQLNNHWYGGGGVPAVHADKHYLKFRPGTSELYECNDGGIYKTTNGSTWTDLSNTLFISQIYGLSTSQTNPDITITGLQDNGTKMRENNNWYDVIGGDGMRCIVDPTDENTQYGSLYYGQIYRTDDMWNSSTDISDNIPGGAGGAWVTPYILDPNDNNILYVGYNNLWKSTDKGESFEDLGSFGTLHSIAMAQANSNYICVATYQTIYLSVNGGDTWENITNNLPTGTASITDISFAQNNPEIIWVTFGAYSEHSVYQTDNGGDSWINISQGLPEIPVNSIIQNKLETTDISLYIGTDFGVYCKSGSNDWMLYGIMPLSVVNDLDIYYNYNNPFESKLRAATYGRGLWEAYLEMTGNFVPYISSNTISNVTQNSASAEGTILNDFGSTVIESGFVVSTSPNPAVSDPSDFIFLTEPIVTNGQFTVDITDLEPGTNYFCKSFAENANGIGYGNELTFTTECSVLSDIPYIQNFETAEDLPVCWSQQYISGENINWTFGDNNYFNPYSGNNCAFLYDISTTEDKTMLILPIFNFSNFSDLNLSFWHIQPPTFSFQDELKVYYKSESFPEWIELAYYDEPVTSWTFRQIDLPNLSENYYIAFEGNAKAGKAVGIDEVKIDLGNFMIEDTNDGIVIIPNPGTGNIKLEGIDIYPVKIELSDYTGKNIYADIIYKNEIDFSMLKKGIYVLKIDNADQIVVKKLIIR